jgi:hypothetical protein
MLVTTGITFISAMQTTRIMSGQLVRNASTTGERGTAFASLSSLASAKAGVSATSRRMIQPATMTRKLRRNGMRQPQKASSGMNRASGRSGKCRRIETQARARMNCAIEGTEPKASSPDSPELRLPIAVSNPSILR